MIMEVPHNYGNSWVFFVIVPIILFGFLACLWLIVRGAIGLFGETRLEGHDRRCAAPQSIPRGGTQEYGVLTHELLKRPRTFPPAIRGAPLRK
jgi:hypothetical protein